MRHRPISICLFECALVLASAFLSAGAQTTIPNEWTWMGGSNQIPTQFYFNGYGWPGVYGTMGTPAAGNIPGSRAGAASWVDPSGNLWLYGGYGFDSVGTIGYLGDLWVFDPATDEWTWIEGANTIPSCWEGNGCSVLPVVGAMGTFAAGNTPGGVGWPSSWTDSSGHFWLFGGSSSNTQWEYNPSTNEWAWIAGSSTMQCDGGRTVCGVYGTLQVPAPGNMPGSRDEASNWIDSGGHLWLFGGGGTDANGNGGDLNDLWEYYPSTNEWAWISGSSTVDSNYTRPGIYGTLGQPSPADTPGARDLASSWTDKNGNLWLFGGQGSDDTDQQGDLNDLWKFDTSTNEWTWMGGSSSFVPLDCYTDSFGIYICAYGEPGVYGTIEAKCTRSFRTLSA
jgi:hypothetical protein